MRLHVVTRAVSAAASRCARRRLSSVGWMVKRVTSGDGAIPCAVAPRREESKAVEILDFG